MKYWQCFFPNPFKSLITYKTNLSIVPGQLIHVPFGKKTVWAWTWSTSIDSDLDQEKIKKISSVSQPFIMPQPHLEWLSQMSQYYCLNIADWLSSTVPSALWQSPKSLPSWYHFEVVASDKTPISKTQQKLQSSISSNTPRPCYAWLQDGVRIDTLEAMLSQQYLNTQKLDLRPNLHKLNQEQQNVFEQIKSTNGFVTTCLEGATGSGKTEVYAHLIHSILRKNKAVLMLVPEIALTKHLVDRVRHTVGVDPVIYHSDIRSQLRLLHWHLAMSGEPLLWLGTRSAISLPLKNIGLIIVDEEHDSSFRNMTHLRYCARDAAILKAKIENIPIVLGSATPCLHTVHNVNTKRFKHYMLSPYWAREYNIHTIDCRGIELKDGFHHRVIDKISQYIEKKQQILVFINRRGYAPVTMCRQCGHAHQCKHCDKTTTYHQKQNIQKCHACGATYSVPKDCPEHPNSMIQIGYGTERVCEILRNLYPNEYIAQIDRDTKDKQRQSDLAALNKGTPMILVGTQMIAKGFDAPNIRLVVILGTDQALYADDYRSEEKAFQLISQVIGRAGRRPTEKTQNNILIQTHLPDHPMLVAVKNQNGQAFRAHLLQSRKNNLLPPYGSISTIWLESKVESKLIEYGRSLVKMLPKSELIKTFGPLPAKTKRRKDFFCYQIIIHSACRHTMVQWLDYISQKVIQKPKNIQIIIDRDSRN